MRRYHPYLSAYLVDAAWLGCAAWMWSGGQRIGAIVIAGTAAITTVFTVFHEVRWRRSEKGHLVMELVALIQARAGGLWVNRDARQTFSPGMAGSRLLPRWVLARADDGQLDELEELDRVATTGDLFSIISLSPEVYRYEVGGVATLGEDGEAVLTMDKPQASRARYAWRHWRAERKGLLYAGVEELREVVTQFRDAEHFEEPEEGEDGELAC